MLLLVSMLYYKTTPTPVFKCKVTWINNTMWLVRVMYSTKESQKWAIHICAISTPRGAYISWSHFSAGLDGSFGGTSFESRSMRIFVIVAMHIQCSKLFKGMECTVLLWYQVKEPLKSFGIRVGHSPGFGLLSVAILPWLCRKRRKAIFIFISQ